jgi:hypothetical protein
VAYHRALGTKIEINNIFSIIPQPDYSVFITCPRERWQRVLRSKGDLDWYEKRLLGDANLADLIESEYDSFGLKKIENIEITDALNILKSDIRLIFEKYHE